MKLLAIDPGPVESAWVIWDGEKIIDKGKHPNDAVLEILEYRNAQYLAIEMIASYGMPVGAEVFETCVWIGKFLREWENSAKQLACRVETEPIRIPRIQIKNHLCHSSKAKDANVRQALIDRLGPQGTKKRPGPTFGVSGDIWSALAVAITVYDQLAYRKAVVA